ncbi:MAG TPA: TIM44-like domain-containing protein [Bacteroidia bacterium]|nr:TIM44-like domain-containing protein [Bacteroidia bacterium]
MKKLPSSLNNIYIALSTFCFLVSQSVFARAGGGGGHSHSHSSGSHSGGGFGGGSGFYSTGSGGGGHLSVGTIVIIIIVVVVIFLYLKQSGKLGSMSGDDDGDEEVQNMPDKPLPEGLDREKIKSSFLSIQDAWQKKDLKHVRKWVSDGVYQRFNAQFAMMNKLAQVNKLTNINVNGIKLANAGADGHYQTADVAISFTMDDEFLSEKYPSFNQKFRGESAMEYWTFIKRNDAQQNKNLYNDANCPNCGAPFDVAMGEISRCSSCGTLTNNASYDWVLSEITQQDDYNGGTNFSRLHELQELTKHDTLFSVQRIEDVASNVFMQIMEVLSGAPEKKLTRFADEETTKNILAHKKELGNFIFDRLYLNDVDLVDFNTSNDRLNLIFALKATYQRVQAGDKLKLIDNDMVTKQYAIILSKNIKALQTAEKETVYSYECASCGAPFTDTTNDVCPYCSAPIIDFNKNWVLTFFKMS